MKQGSILSYLQRPTAAAKDKDQLAQSSSPSTLLLVADESPVVHVAKSQERAISSNIGEHGITDASRTTLEQSIKLRDPRASITKVYPSHVDRLKSITSTLLPVRYSDRFFAECLESENDTVLSYTSLFDSKPVGWIRCRLEPFPNPERPVYQQIYIQAVGVLAPYRGMGMGSALLNSVLSSRPEARSIYAHVWETNEDALEWYENHGFQRVLLVPQYSTLR